MLEEPTSALDLNRQIRLLTVLRRLADERQMLILVALHDLGMRCASLTPPYCWKTGD
nr:hypothetical protein [Halomonas sp.]